MFSQRFLEWQISGYYSLFHLAVAGLVKVFDLKHRALVVVGIGHPIKGLEVVQVPLELHLQGRPA